MSLRWEEKYARCTQLMKVSAIRELLKVTELPEVISFAGGLPAPELLPTAEVAAATDEVLRTHGGQALQYGATEGYTPLRAWIAEHLSSADITLAPENIVITTGSQQALDLIGKIFLNPGDSTLVEAPTYMGALQAWAPYDPHYIGMPIDEQGMITTELERALQQHHPKLIYVLPNFQNPAGVTLAYERRQQLVDLTARYDIPVLEDDAYAQLRFDGDALPSLFQLSSCLAQTKQPGNILYLGSFSKVLSPGMRLGWIAAPEEVISKLVQAKQGVDLHTSMLSQMIAYTLVSQGFLEKQVPLIRQLYRARRDAMLAALESYFPAGAHWTHPTGGMFLWVTLPAEVHTGGLLSEALEEKVAFVPGAAFFAQGGGHNTMRLNFSNATPEQIDTGIKRLARVVRKHLG